MKLSVVYVHHIIPGDKKRASDNSWRLNDGACLSESALSGRQLHSVTEVYHHDETLI